MKLTFFLFSLIFFLSLQAFAQATRLNAAEDYKGDSWSVTFGASYTSRVLWHNESGTDPAYVTTGRRIRVPDVNLSLSVIKEFMNTQKISVTAILLGGIADSTGKSGGENLEPLEEKLEGYHIGGGLTVNYNTYSYGLKLQPYVGAKIISEQGELNLLHNNGGTQLNTIHEFEAQLVHLGIGVRAFDADYNLMSYFEINTPQVMSESYSPVGQVTGTNIPITSETEITRDPVAFAMGFGYYF